MNIWVYSALVVLRCSDLYPELIHVCGSLLLTIWHHSRPTGDVHYQYQIIHARWCNTALMSIPKHKQRAVMHPYSGCNCLHWYSNLMGALNEAFPLIVTLSTPCYRETGRLRYLSTTGICFCIVDLRLLEFLPENWSYENPKMMVA